MPFPPFLVGYHPVPSKPLWRFHAMPPGKTVYAKSVEIRSNTDAAWLRGARRPVDSIAKRSHHMR